jgi:DNA-binding NarL/FixJ family response regulator
MAGLMPADGSADRDTGRTRVLVVEDDRVAREGLRALIDGTPGFVCVAACRSVEEALGSKPREAPDVVLLDVELPGMSGSEGVRPLRERFDPAPIVMLTIYEEPERVFESICNGASGYLLKRTPPAKLLESIAEVRKGGAPMSPEIARQVVRLFRRIAPPPQIERELSPQETHVLALLAEGYSYQGAADRMHVSVNTVRNYIRSIYDKLHVHTKSEAVSKAIKARLI